jgi:carbamate kinase
MPLDVCVALSPGSIGYMIERMMHMILRKYNLPHEVVTLVTMVVVNNADEAFQNPSKRVGKIYSEDQKNELSEKKGWIFKEEIKSQGGWRRVVPSPKPISIMNEKVVETMARQGTIVIASGGGGIPVYIDEENNIRPAEAVIDKDLASSLLASRIGADEFYILTDVPYIYLNYKKPDQQILEFLDYKDALKHLEAGVFGEGSMAPKIRAALQFIEKGGRKSVITEATKLVDKKYGSKITMKYED